MQRPRFRRHGDHSNRVFQSSQKPCRSRHVGHTRKQRTRRRKMKCALDRMRFWKLLALTYLVVSYRSSERRVSAIWRLSSKKVFLIFAPTSQYLFFSNLTTHQGCLCRRSHGTATRCFFLHAHGRYFWLLLLVDWTYLSADTHGNV